MNDQITYGASLVAVITTRLTGVAVFQEAVDGDHQVPAAIEKDRSLVRTASVTVCMIMITIIVMVHLSATAQNESCQVVEACRALPSLVVLAGQHTDPPSYKTQRRLSASESTELVAAYEAGGTIRGLAATFGMSRDGVRSSLRQAGVAFRRVELSAAQLEEAHGLLAEGWSLNRLGAKYGIDPKTVKSRLTSYSGRTESR